MDLRSKKEFMAFSALVAEKAAAKEREACDKWRQALTTKWLLRISV